MRQCFPAVLRRSVAPVFVRVVLGCLWFVAVVGGQVLGGSVVGANFDAEETRPVDAVPGEVVVRFRETVSQIGKQTLLDQWNGTFRHLGPQGNRVGSVQPQGIVRAESGLLSHLSVLRVKDPSLTQGVLRRLRQSEGVVYAEPNYRLRVFNAAAFPPRPFPDDIEFSRQWSLRNTGQGAGKAGVDLSMAEAWKITTGDRRVKVAVIDTGIDYFHPDLIHNIWTNPGETPENGEDDDGNGYVDDVHGYDFVSDDGDPFDDLNHGTHVAGIIGAEGNNQAGVAGICWKISLMALKAFDETGSSDIAHVIEAIEYAIDKKAHVINASWGGPDKSLALEEAVNRAHRAGIVFVAAAGNDRTDTAPSPANYPVTLAVGATDRNDQRAFFSNFGKYVDLAAPGVEILSTYPDSSYDFSSGTSMAAPHVSGVAALIFALHPEFTNTDVENILMNTTDPLSADHPIGVGRVNALRALSILERLPEARLKLPELTQGVVNVLGSAEGDSFASYELAVEDSSTSEGWRVLNRGTAPVSNGVLASGFDTSVLTDGNHTFRLTVAGRSGQIARAQEIVNIRNVRIAFPLNNDVLRAGTLIDIIGSVFGAGLEYTVDYGVGWSPTEWMASGLEIVKGGRVEALQQTLARWDTSQVEPNQFYTLRLVARKAGQTVAEHQVPMLYLDGQLRPGWPRYLAISSGFPVEDWRQPSTMDLDGDGVQEIILVDHGNDEGRPAELKVFRADGTLFWSRVLGIGEPYSDVPVIGDMDGDGHPEIFVDAGAGRQISAFRWDGSPYGNGWPVKMNAGNLGKVVADLDHDGFLELITLSRETVSVSGNDYRQLTVLNRKGEIVRQWPIPPCDFEGDAPELLPAVGNFDADEALELVASYGCSRIAMFDLTKADGPVWVASVEGILKSSPVVGDLNGDGTNEVVVGSYDSEDRNRGGIYVFNHLGKRWSNFPVLLEESFVNAPALADFEGDGMLEICVTSSNFRRIHILRQDGFEADGWPVGERLKGTLRSGPVIGDVDGDGRPDVVAPVLGQMRQVVSAGDVSLAGGVMAWSFAGRQIRWGGAGGVGVLLMEAAGGGNRLKTSPVTLTDLDGNGSLDVVAVSIQEAAYSVGDDPVTRKNRSSLYVWEVPTPYDRAAMPWPMWQRDGGRSGYFVPSRRLNVRPVILGIPNQIARTGEPFFSIRLDRYVEDPNDPPSTMQWSIAGNRELKAEVSGARRLLVTAPDRFWSGREELTLTVTDRGGLSTEARVSFEMRPDYVAPLVLDDRMVVIEDGDVVFDPLANDIDSRGGALRLVEFSKAEHGVAVSQPDRRLRYIPNPDFFGTDSFTYTAIDSEGGFAMANVEITVTPVPDAPRAETDKVIGEEDTTIQFDMTANDLDPEGELFRVVNWTDPANGVLRALSSGQFTYLPSSDFFGTDRFTYTVRDASGMEAVGEVLIAIKPALDLPVAKDQSLILNRNQSKGITYSADNPDKDTLNFVVVDGPEHGDLWTYPGVATYFPKKGYSGTDRFTYRANNGSEQGPIATITLAVTANNNVPVASDLEITTKPARDLPLALTAKDDDEKETLTVRIRSQPEHGTLGGIGTNWVYRSSDGFLGSDRFEFIVHDAESESVPGVVRILVTDVNTAPTVGDRKVDVFLNTATEVMLSAKDGENDPLRYEILSPPERGAVTGTAPALTYTPATDFTGYDRLSYRVSDGIEQSSSATITLRVLSRNQPPVSTNQSLSVVNTRVLKAGLGVFDPDGDSLRCPILKGPKNGKLAVQGTNFIYTAKKGFVGGDGFTFRAWDGTRYSAVGRVSISVSSPTPVEKPSFGPLERETDGQVKLTLRAPAGYRCRIEASTDLVSWGFIATLLFEEEALQWVDFGDGGRALRFYRAIVESLPDG